MCGDKDTVIRGPVCDRGPVDRGNQAVAGGPDLKVMQYSHLSSSEAALYHLTALCELISLSGQDCGLVSSVSVCFMTFILLCTEF